MSRISENQLILPSLYLFLDSKTGLSTSDLRNKLTLIFRPQGEDAAILAGRTDTKFSQIVRNLKSHDTFEREGYAKFENDVYKITNKGRVYLEKHIDVMQYLFSSNFQFEDIKESLDKLNQGISEGKKTILYDERCQVREGDAIFKESKVYKRSSKLRKYAIKKFKTENGIFCEVCNFNFEKFYGEIGKNFIEIHHKKPIFTFDQNDFDQTLALALVNLSPLCANCHRMIHRNSSELSLEILKQFIEAASTPD
jgi:5-methylcytosine-specific restriction enzyme A